MKLLTTAKNILLDEWDDFITFTVKGEEYDPNSTKHLHWRRSGFHKGALLVFNPTALRFSKSVTLVREECDGEKKCVNYTADDAPILYLGYRKETFLGRRFDAGYSTNIASRVKHYFLNQNGISVFYSYRQLSDVGEGGRILLSRWDLRLHFKEYQTSRV